VRSALVFLLLLAVKGLSRVFFRVRIEWIRIPEAKPFANVRLVVFLNHTSLYEPIFLAVVPPGFLWRLARHGVLPAASKTTRRLLVGLFYKFFAAHVLPVSRERDASWFAVLERIDPDSMVVIAPEGRMMRRNGLDAAGSPMTVRGGVADILTAVGRGKMLVAISGGLHHIQSPGEWPRPFKTARVRAEILEIGAYLSEVGGAENPDLKALVKADLERRRDANKG
jgi:1-acyl-sn-glycerol-3-phosphate acyltransferase